MAIGPLSALAAQRALEPATARSAPPVAAADSLTPWSADRAALVEGVDAIAAPGVPGAIAVFGPDAFPVILGAEGAGERPTVAAARARQGRAASAPTAVEPVAAAEGAAAREGRLVVLSHNGYANADAIDFGQTRRFFLNAVRWAGASSDEPVVGVRRAPALATALGAAAPEAGIAVVQLDGAEWIERLPTIDVLVFFEGDATPAELDALRAHLARGGGIVVGVCPWGWAQVRRLKVSESPVNRLLGEFGLAWTDGTVAPTKDGGFGTAPAPSLLHQAASAFERLSSEGPELPLDRAARAQAAATIVDALRALPADDRLLRPALAARAAERGAALLPSESAPLGPERGLDRVLLTALIASLDDGSPETLAGVLPLAREAAAAFPGAVSEEAPRVAARVEVELSAPQWHSTGLYAPPGEPLRVTVTEEASRLGLALQVGCHTDRLWHLERWKRVPEIALRVPLAAPVTELIAPFGGLIYLDVPERRSGTTTVAIDGAVEAPRFVLGVTTAEEWAQQRREAAARAPWGELETSKVILSLPTARLVELEDPTELLHFWDSILDAAADLATISRERRRPERYVPDLQISAGYMHAGYPIMTHMDAIEDMTTLENLRRGSWGLFHELGHNHQDPMWTFEGTGEVTVNLFSLYICQRLCGLGPRDGHPALADRERMTAAYRSGGRRRQGGPEAGLAGPSFERWKQDPFLALIMYQELQEAFGWEAYKRVFAEYRSLRGPERPRTEEEKRDQWMVRFSRSVGRNLGPFFDWWGVPVSEAAKASVADLPEWMPARQVRSERHDGGGPKP
ncbi:MAG TPA: M60 family metallopeptidase [Phycisphaerales bacterium]|nr:M60 family metallopeptidase [Phycisphaerales bacterium]HMP36969.1 M60 family metallopeptidase [Phycisphaerales bacterium]